jgi:hypothetical protein
MSVFVPAEREPFGMKLSPFDSTTAENAQIDILEIRKLQQPLLLIYYSGAHPSDAYLRFRPEKET